MPKKDTSSAVLGMLSSAGAQTRPVAPPTAPTPPAAEERAAVPRAIGFATRPQAGPGASVTDHVAPAPARGDADKTPRTLRLQPSTARALREAWLEAKRDDVLLTAQDFASALVDEALTRRRRQQAAIAR